MPLKGQVRADFIRFIGNCRLGQKSGLHTRKRNSGGGGGCNFYGVRTGSTSSKVDTGITDRAKEMYMIISIVVARATRADPTRAGTETRAGTGVRVGVKGN